MATEEGGRRNKLQEFFFSRIAGLEKYSLKSFATVVVEPGLKKTKKKKNGQEQEGSIFVAY